MKPSYFKLTLVLLPVLLTGLLTNTASAATYDWSTAFSFDVFNVRTHSAAYQDLTIAVTDNIDSMGWPSASTNTSTNRLNYYGSGWSNSSLGPVLMRITKTNGSSFTPTGTLTLYYNTYHPEPNPPFTYQTSTVHIRAYSGTTLTGTVSQSITGPAASFTITFSSQTGFSNITALEFDNGKQELAIGTLTLGSAATAPTVTTAAQSAVTATSATLGGNVTADGGATVTERGIVWNTATGPTTSNNKVINGSGTGAFSATVTGLPSNTTIHVRAYAINSVNTSYGSGISFNTLPAPVAIASLNRVNTTPTNAASVNWTLTFASAVTGVTASNFSLTGTSAAGSAVGTPTTSNNITWNIPVTTGSTDGPLTLRLANATGLSAPTSTTLPFDGQSYDLDKTSPQIVSINRLTPTGQTTNATSVTFRVTYSEAVSLNAPATARFQVVPVSSTVMGTVQSVTGSGNTRDVTVNLTSGSGEFRLRGVD